MRSLLAISALLAALTGCKKAPQVSTTSYVIGDSDDIETVEGRVREEIPEKHLNANVLLGIRIDDVRRKFCSGTLIEGATPEENPRIITNHHCFTDDGNGRGAIPRSTVKDPCGSVFVHFRFIKGETDSSPKGRCLAGSFRNDYEGDLAVFTLAESPGSRYKPAKFWSGEVDGGRQARIVHHPSLSDTGGEARENQVYDPTLGVSFPVAQVTRHNCTTVGLFPQVEWGLDKALAMGVKHTCDQRKGSSGSSLWDVETETILGINWGGIVLTYNNRTEDSETFNVATRAPYVLAFLEGRLEQVKGEIAMGTELPNNEAKLSSAGAKTKEALRTGCGVIGHGENNSFNAVLLLFVLASPLFIILAGRLKKRHTRRA